MIVLCVSCILIFQSNIVWAESPSVIIIGAGPAGIAAATKLLENSINNITILEAENRIGGRIHSVEFGNGYVDLGAEYCGGQKGNIVYELVKDLDLLEHSISSENLKIYTSQGCTVPEDFATDLFNVVVNYKEEINTTESLSLGEAFLEKYNATILKKYKHDKKKYKLASDAIKMTEHLILIDEGTFNWNRSSAAMHFKDCEGDIGMSWKIRGYHIILDILMKNYPNSSQKLPIDDKILLNKKVGKIIWSNKQVEVKCTDNSSLKADYVIFTPSLGVLKSQKDTLFEPQLPAKKFEAFEALDIDGVMKIVFHFPEKWWKEKDEDFFFLWNSEDLPNIVKEFPEGPNQNGISWVASISTLVRVRSNRNAFIAWVSGELLSEIENIPDDVLVRGCYYVFQKFLGKDYNVTKADKIMRSRWITNPNFLGTYSYEKAGYFKEDVSYQAMLAEPLKNAEGNSVVLFAGEATHPTQYSTVHGAIQTGFREAQRIINLHK